MGRSDTRDRYAHHRDEVYHAMCERIARRAAATASPSAIEPYSTEKLAQINELAERARRGVRQGTGACRGLATPSRR